MHIHILDTTTPPEFLQIEEYNLTPFIACGECRWEEVFQYRCRSIVFARVDFDTGEGSRGCIW